MSEHANESEQPIIDETDETPATARQLPGQPKKTGAGRPADPADRPTRPSEPIPRGSDGRE